MLCTTALKDYQNLEVYIRLQRSVLVAEMHIYFVAPFLATHNYSNLVCGR